MARPEFEVPDFVADSDSDQIQERMMGNLPADISDMEEIFHTILPCQQPSKYLSCYSLIWYAV